MTNEEFIESIRLQGEEWRDVVGWEGYYKVSSFGRIIVLSRHVKRSYNDSFLTAPKLTKLQTSTNGYLRVGLTAQGRRQFALVHRIVASAFIPNPLNYPCIDHIDCNKENNHKENLRWCTQSQNCLNPISRNRNSKNKKGKRAEWTCRSVVCLKNGTPIKTYYAIRDAFEDGHIEQCISRVCRGLRKTYHGYEWMYLSDYENLVISKSKNECPTLGLVTQ